MPEDMQHHKELYAATDLMNEFYTVAMNHNEGVRNMSR